MRDLTVCRQMLARSTPSMCMLPLPCRSASRKSVAMSDDLPLMRGTYIVSRRMFSLQRASLTYLPDRPQIPTFWPGDNDTETPFSTGSSPELYLELECSFQISSHNRGANL